MAQQTSCTQLWLHNINSSYTNNPNYNNQGPVNTQPRSNNNRETRNLQLFHDNSKEPYSHGFNSLEFDSNRNDSHSHHSHHNHMHYHDDNQNNSPIQKDDSFFGDHNNTHLTQEPKDHHWDSSEGFLIKNLMTTTTIPALILLPWQQ